MASVRYRKRGDSNLWTYEIRNEGKTVAHNSGFKIITTRLTGGLIKGYKPIIPASA